MARPDDIGMFWEDIKQEGRSAIVRVMPDIPDTGWVKPSFLPDLSNAPIIAVDCETFDPDLLTLGPGWARNRGHLVGVSVGVPGGHRWYFPLRHEVEPADNWPVEPVLQWLQETLGNPKQHKVGANLTYDVGWLRQEGVIVRGPLLDVQFAEALLSESSEVALEVMAQKYLGEGKESSVLYRWCADFYGGACNGRQRANIYRTPPRLTGPYAESDADLPLRLIEKLWPLLARENLLELFQMECDLIYLAIEMRYAGVRVDIDKAEQLREVLLGKADEAHKVLRGLVGFEVNVNAADSLAKAFDSIGLSYGKTTKGNPSFTKAFLQGIKHPVADAINNIRKLEKLRGTFVESYVLSSHVNGMVYGQFHQLRGDGGGTRSGRFSSSTPNLQNLPSRDDELAPLVRGLFVPDYGHTLWRRYDYSQVEYRMLIHFAIGEGSQEARQRFNDHPDTDYHEWTQDLVLVKTGQALNRKAIKNINFGLIYGMGIATLTDSLGLTPKEGKLLAKAYHEGVPFAKETMNGCMEEVQRTGKITTILGRCSRFDSWEPVGWDRGSIPVPYEKAITQWREIQRAHTHKALNRKLQGSAADLMKKAMWLCWKDGVFDATGIPRLTVHDELDFSDPGGREEAFREMQYRMEHALPLSIPIKADGEQGPDWGHCKDKIE